MVDYLVDILHIFFIFVVLVMLTYAIRHFIFTFNRLYCRQKFYYQDIIDSDLPKVTVLIPMHNEEQVATGVLDALLACDYPADRLEINRLMIIRKIRPRKFWKLTILSILM